MTRFKAMIVGAAAGALLAVIGVAAIVSALNPTAAEVATKVAHQSNPGDPPTFYGTR